MTNPGNDLTIILFFIGTAISVAGTAVSAAGWRHPAFIGGLFSIAGVCAIVGMTWPALKTVSPLVTAMVNQVATNPVAWFVVLILGVASSLLRPKPGVKTADSVKQEIGRAPAIPSETIGSSDLQWQFDSQMASAIATRLRNRPEWQDKIIVDVPPEHIWNLFRGCSTSMEGDMLTRRFLNKWMVVCGPFGDVKRLLGNTIVVRFAIRNDLAIVFMYFNEDSLDALELLIPKQKISVIGRIDLIQSDRLNLENCKIVQ